MNTASKENSASLFTIEKVSSAPTALSQLSGCDLCQHCTLLRLLAQSRLGQPAVGEGLMGSAQGTIPTNGSPPRADPDGGKWTCRDRALR